MQLLGFVSLLLYMWVGIFTFGNCSLAYTFYSVIPCYSLINYIRLIKRQVDCSSNSNFKLNPKFYKLWKQIQILAYAYNSIHQNCITIVLSTLTAFVYIASLYTAVRFNETLYSLQVCIFALFVFQTLIWTIELDGSAKAMVCVKSRDCYE